MQAHEIENRLHILVRNERKITGEILELIRDAEELRLPQQRGFSSTHLWLIKVYGYSESAANRRVHAARLLPFVPKEKIEEGDLNLTTMAQAGMAFRRAEATEEEKKEVLAEIEGKTAAETQKILSTHFPEQPKKETLRSVSEEESRLSLILSAQGREDLERVRELLSHALPNASWGEIVAHLAALFVKKPAQSATVTKALSAKRKEQVKERAGHKCEYVDEETGRRCDSSYQLEVDHIPPKSLGGSDEPENLRALCKQHNLLEAERKLGKEKMRDYRARP